MNQRTVNERLAALGAEESWLRYLDAREAGEANPPNRDRNAKRLQEIQKERAAIGPAEEPLPPDLVYATVKMSIDRATVGANVGGLVEIVNDSDDEVTVIEVDPFVRPSALVGRVALPPRGKVIPAHDSRSFAIDLVAHHPRVGPSIDHLVGANVRLSTDAQIVAAPANITIRSLFDV